MIQDHTPEFRQQQAELARRETLARGTGIPAGFQSPPVMDAVARLTAERDALMAELEKARAAVPAAQPEPLFWYRPVCNGEMYEGPVHHNSVGGKMLRDEKPNEWLPLYSAPQHQESTRTSREEFEAWVTDESKWPAAAQRTGDTYRLMTTQQQWIAWQAARAAAPSRTHPDHETRWRCFASGSSTTTTSQR